MENFLRPIREIWSRIKALDTRGRLVASGILVFIIFLGILPIYLYLKPQIIDLDTPLRESLKKIGSIHSYSQYIETETEISGRGLKIVGQYDVDSPNDSFAALSTTTLIIKNDPFGHIFTLQNISIGDDIYTKIETQDLLLKQSIQNSLEWHHFKRATIPESFIGIAVSGPIQDNLQILSDNGSWLVLVKKEGVEEWGHESLLRYTFKLSNRVLPDEGALSAILSRIGSEGTVDLWLQSDTFEPRYMRFKNDSYISTTTITHINTPLLIKKPGLQ